MDKVFQFEDFGTDPQSAGFVERFRQIVVGQPGAEEIAEMVFTAYKNPLRDMNRPLGVFALIGQSRTGKTRTAKALAKLLHNNEEALTKIDCGDYLSDHQLIDIKGAPVSYKGYIEPHEVAQLKPNEKDPTSKLSPHNLRRARKGSSCKINIVVLDEFDRGIDVLYQLFMGIFDDASFTFGNGIKATYCNTVFILTMNLGMDQVERLQDRVGFKTSDTAVTQTDIETVVFKAMKRRFKPEFRNRLDKVVIFKTHSRADLLAIVGTEIAQIQERIMNVLNARHCFRLKIDDAACEKVLQLAEQYGEGAAAIKKVVEQKIVPVLGRASTQGILGYADLATITVDREELALKVEEGVADEELFKLMTVNSGRRNSLDESDLETVLAQPFGRALPADENRRSLR